MKFCKVCNNMYYIKISEDNSNSLFYYCRNCGDEDSDTKDTLVINKSVFKNDEKDFNTFINEYTHLDPTLPRTNLIKCVNDECVTNIDEKTLPEIIYIRYDDVNVLYAYLCSTCKTCWKIAK